MTCWYYNDAPRLKIKPAKVERVFVKPEIIIFRGILAESELNTIKELASPRVMYSDTFLFSSFLLWYKFCAVEFVKRQLRLRLMSQNFASFLHTAVTMQSTFCGGKGWSFH